MKVKGKRIIHSSGGDIDMGDVELEDFIMPEAKEVKDRWFEGIRMVEGWEAKSRKLRGIFSKMGYENITAVALLNVVVPIGYRHDELAIRSADFWFFPIETLSRGVGDCEDTTFLLSSLYSFDPMVSNRYWACLGYYRQNGRLYGHAFVLFNNSYFERMNYGRWVVMETTLERPMSPFLQLTWTGEDSNWIPAMIFRKGWEGYYKFEFYSLDDPKGREILGLGDGWFRKYERYIDEMKEYVLGGKLMKRKWMHKSKRPPIRSFTMPEMRRALMRKRSRA